MKEKKYKLVYIEWADAISTPSWFSEEGAIEWGDESTWIVKEVGWIIKETDEYILMASRILEKCEINDELLGLIQKIPKTWIRKRKTLKI